MDVPFTVVGYEILMFLGAQILQKAKISVSNETLTLTNENIDRLLQNALTETRVLHVRVLTEVFLSGGRADDIKINHLLPDWHRQNSTILQELKDAYETPLPETGESPKTLIDKLLAHATTKRGASFYWGPVVNKMDPPLLKVLKALPANQFPSLSLLQDI